MEMGQPCRSSTFQSFGGLSPRRPSHSRPTCSRDVTQAVWPDSRGGRAPAPAPSSPHRSQAARCAAPVAGLIPLTPRRFTLRRDGQTCVTL